MHTISSMSMVIYHRVLVPHTQNYTCKNPNCSTHKNPLTKDSVFYKERNSYKLTYI